MTSSVQRYPVLYKQAVEHTLPLLFPVDATAPFGCATIRLMVWFAVSKNLHAPNEMQMNRRVWESTRLPFRLSIRICGNPSKLAPKCHIYEMKISPNQTELVSFFANWSTWTILSRQEDMVDFSKNPNEMSVTNYCPRDSEFERESLFPLSTVLRGMMVPDNMLLGKRRLGEPVTFCGVNNQVLNIYLLKEDHMAPLLRRHVVSTRMSKSKSVDQDILCVTTLYLTHSNMWPKQATGFNQESEFFPLINKQQQPTAAGSVWNRSVVCWRSTL